MTENQNNKCLKSIWSPERENYSWKYEYVNPLSWGKNFNLLKNNNQGQRKQAQKNLSDTINEVKCSDSIFNIKNPVYISGPWGNIDNNISLDIHNSGDKRYDQVRIKCSKDFSNMDESEKIACCSGAEDSRNCPPDLCKNSDLCNSIMDNHCSKGNNITTLPECKNIKEYNSWLHNNILKNYCTDPNNLNNLTDDNCKEYCKNNLDECESNLKDFCNDKVSNHLYSDICGCY